jgi:BirA family biotin operon repressor/biotin-[acetyl-CoA-carboxylase] ligase
VIGVPHRDPLNRDRIAGEVLGPGHLWTSLEVADSLTSSNDVLADRARSGLAAHGAVLIAEEQTRGRGRRGREWKAPRYSSVMVSIVVRPQVEETQWAWIPLLTALAVTDAVAKAGVTASIKWPNDVMVGASKLGGILGEVVTLPEGSAAVVGWGVNVDQSADELPASGATSLLLSRGSLDRAALVVNCLRAWEGWFQLWRREVSPGGTPLADHGEPRLSSVAQEFRRRCSTLGRKVQVSNPDGSTLSGTAIDLDAHGHLLLDVDGRTLTVAAADVVHLRGDGLRP